MRVGILGGTFDPIHLGHLIVAEEARVTLGLDHVLFIPTGEPWLKRGTYLSPAVHRLKMVRLAIATNPFFQASSIEVDRPGPSYTVDTLEALGKEMPKNTQLLFILGQDSLKELRRWHEPARILGLCTLVAVSRPGHTEHHAEILEEIVPGASRRVLRLNTVHIGISGTGIRQRVARGLSIRYLVPDPVYSYILDNHLYQEAQSNG